MSFSSLTGWTGCCSSTTMITMSRWLEGSDLKLSHARSIYRYMLNIAKNTPEAFGNCSSNCKSFGCLYNPLKLGVLFFGYMFHPHSDRQFQDEKSCGSNPRYPKENVRKPPCDHHRSATTPALLWWRSSLLKADLLFIRVITKLKKQKDPHLQIHNPPPPFEKISPKSKLPPPPPKKNPHLLRS